MEANALPTGTPAQQAELHFTEACILAECQSSAKPIQLSPRSFNLLKEFIVLSQSAVKCDTE